MFRMPPVKVAKFVPDVINEFSTILQRNIEKMNAFVEACSDTGTNSKVLTCELGNIIAVEMREKRTITEPVLEFVNMTNHFYLQTT